MSLYGNRTLTAAGEIFNHIPKENVLGYWAYFGKFVYEQFKDEIKDEDPKVVEKMLHTIKDQNHSGGSIGVVIQDMFEYLGGTMDDKQKEIVKGATKYV